VVRKASATKQPTTFGEHIREARRARRLHQWQAAREIGVTKETVANWEKGKTEPPVQVMSAVIRFLGFDPSPSPDSPDLGSRMLRYRRQHGLSIKEAAGRAGVDPDSWATWERTGSIPSGRGRELVETLLARR
jgi:transcriptional regulator with XRE-family HTH domain